MGAQVSKACTSCFSAQDSEVKKELIPKTDRSDGDSTAFHSPVMVGHMINSTSPYEQIAHAVSQKFLDRIHQPFLEGFVQLVDKDGFKVMAKDTSEGFLIWSEFKIPFKPQQFVSFLSKTEKRKLWDSNVQEVSKICQVNASTYLTYSVFKRILTVSSRDLVVLSTQGQIGDSFYEATSSVDHEEFPVSKSHVRARVIMGGYFVTPLVNDPDGNQAKVVNFNESNLGGSLPMGMVKKLAANAVPKFVNALCEACRQDFAQSSY